MDAVTPAAVGNSSAALPGSVQEAAATSVLKQALDLQASAVTQLLQGLPAPSLATSGVVGTQVNTYA